MRKITLLLVLISFQLTALAQREVINLNRSWQYTPGWEVQRGAGSSEINLPHTWNYDALSGMPNYYRGLGNYVKTIDAPREWKNKRVYIRFKGANQVTDFYVNGKHVGTHRGGYTAFSWDITPYIRLGERNTFWARVTNALDLDVMPLVGDFNFYGGIYRDVDLVITPSSHISFDNYSTDGIYVNTPMVTEQEADVEIVTVVRGYMIDDVQVRTTIKNAANQVIASEVQKVKIGMSGQREIVESFKITNPHLWNSVEDPYMYRVETILTSDRTKTRDSVSQNFGLRYFEVNADNKFLLNGKPFRIQGVGRHQDWAMLGNAIFEENHQRDIELMLEMGVNAVRLTHYPQDPYFIDLCDQAGIIVWSEIPFIGPGGYRDKGFNDSDAFRQNGKMQLLEMIHQLYNHPSIMFWGLFNELVQRGDDPLLYLKELNSLAKEHDPTRLTVGASNQDGDLNFVTDLIGFNQYFGWYGGTPSDLDSWGLTLRKDWSKLKVGLSEYGAGASIYQHSDTLVKPVATSYWHPEQWQTHFHQEYWKIISQKNYFWGTFVWVMFDFGAAHRTEGQRPGINDKGLVTFDRLVPKDAFYFYKANWNTKEPFVYITERRWQERPQAVQQFTVFSNQPYVELFVNGISQGMINNDGQGTFVWKNIQLPLGINKIEAIGGALNSRDEILITMQKPTIKFN